MRLALPAVTIALLPALTGCMGGGNDFDAGSVVAELNAAGAQLELGEPLDSASDDVEVRELGISGAGRGGPPGALVILADEDAAVAEFARCNDAVDFICFRAANAVLRFAELRRADQAQIETALRGIASGG